jgi:ankyrin repeat protein
MDKKKKGNQTKDMSRKKESSLEDQLMEAAEKGHTETVALLLDRGVDIHTENDQALQWAALKGHTETVALLLDRGANIHARNNKALRWAAVNGHTETVALLLDKGANIHTDKGQPLRGAALNGHTETVALLLKHYKTKDLAKWATRTAGNPSELRVKPLAQKEYVKRLAEKAQKIRDSEPEITL